MASVNFEKNDFQKVKSFLTNARTLEQFPDAAHLLPAKDYDSASKEKKTDKFDVVRLPKEASHDVLTLAAGRASSWKQDRFASPADGLPIVYKEREGNRSEPARVYSGGMAFNESFEPLFASGPPAPGTEFFMWTRGHNPTAWKATDSPLDADAHDLAAMVNKAAAATDTGKTELVLHSFGDLVFQRMLQLRDDPYVSEALSHVSRVVMINPLTHMEGSEKSGGPQVEQAAAQTRLFFSNLDFLDAQAKASEALAKVNPFLAPQIYASLAIWHVQRAGMIALGAKQAIDMQRKDLEQPWEPQFEPLRKQAQQKFELDAKDPGWQEATLRRALDSVRLDMKQDDFDYLRKTGIKVDLVHSIHDQLIPYDSAKLLFKMMDIPSPAKSPAAGAELKNADGTFKVHFVDADHYWPLKHPEELKEVLGR